MGHVCIVAATLSVTALGHYCLQTTGLIAEAELESRTRQPRNRWGFVTTSMVFNRKVPKRDSLTVQLLVNRSLVWKQNSLVKDSCHSDCWVLCKPDVHFFWHVHIKMLLSTFSEPA